MTELDRRARRSGTIAEFDSHRGLGEVEANTGDRYLFHCVEIVGGGREIEVGTTVTFELHGKFGRDEAVRVSP